MKKRVLFTSLALVFIFFCYENSIAAGAKKQKIISLAPSTTEILFSLDLADKVIGVTTFCNYPPGALKKEKIGTFSQPDIEKIVFLKPDIIFATGLEQAPTVERLRRLNLKVYVSDPSNMRELFVSIRKIAKLTGKEAASELLIKQMKSKIKKVASKVKKISQNKRTKVFVEIWHDPLMTAGKGTFIDELIQLAGGVNIAYDTPRPYSYFSAEQVIKRNPDCIILGYMTEEKAVDVIKNRLGWNGIKAVKNNRVYSDINSDLFIRPGPRLTQGLEEIYKRLYPQ